ncbi:hypothetical protein AHAS_Ahas09G0087400 [Arachis hypogaea]
MPFLAPIPRHQLALLRYRLHAGMHNSSLYRHRTSLLTSIVTLFGEYSTMVGALYSMIGFSNRGTAATVGREIGIRNESPTLSGLPITVVGTLIHSGCT